MPLLLQLIYNQLLKVTQNVSFNMLPDDIDTSQLYVIYEISENDSRNALDLKNYSSTLGLTVKILHQDSLVIMEKAEEIKELLLSVNDINYNSSVPIFEDVDLGMDQLTLNFEIEHYAGVAGLAVARRLSAYGVEELISGLTEIQKNGLAIGKQLEDYTEAELEAGLTPEQIGYLQLYKALYFYSTTELQAGLTNEQKASLQLYKALTEYSTLELQTGLTPAQISSLQENIGLQEYTVLQLQNGLTFEQIQGLQLYKALSEYTDSELNSGLSTLQKDALQYALSTYLVSELQAELTTAQIDGLQLYKALTAYTNSELQAGLTQAQKDSLQLYQALSEYSIAELEAGLTPAQIEGLQINSDLSEYTVSQLQAGLTESQIAGLQLYKALTAYTISELEAGLTQVQRDGLQVNPEPVIVGSPSNLTASLSGEDTLLNWNSGSENLKIVFLGSSTTEGFGVPEADSFVYKVNQHFAALYTNYVGVNLGLGGTSTYHILPDGSVTANRPSPDTTRNITHAISLSPDLILVNMPSNDTAAGYSNAEFLANLVTIKAEADAAGIPCFITTTQPRNFGTDTVKRNMLKDATVLIMDQFTDKAINIFDELADSAQDYRIKAIYNNGDGTHLTPLGHTYVADTVVSVIEPQISLPSDVDGYRIQRGEVSGSFVQIAETGNVNSYEDSTISDNNQYFYAVKAFKGLFESNNSNIISFFKEVVAATAPDQVTGLTATAPAYNTINLGWVQPANGGSAITGYRIERRTSSGYFSDLVANTGTTTLSYSDNTANASTQYYYRVSAINAVGTGLSSVSANATTPAQPVFSQQMKVNLGGSVGNVYPSAVLPGIDSTWCTIWHDVARDGAASFVLKNIDNVNTPYTLHAESVNPYGWGILAGNNTGDVGAVTGSNTGIVPDNVSKFYWFTSTATSGTNGGKLRISGLTVGSEWRINLLASRDTADARRAGFTINGVTKDIAVGGNTSEFIVFDSVVADTNGEINIIVKASDTWQYGYLNAFTMLPEADATPIEEPALEAPSNFNVTASGLGENTITFN